MNPTILCLDFVQTVTGKMENIAGVKAVKIIAAGLRGEQTPAEILRGGWTTLSDPLPIWVTPGRKKSSHGFATHI